MPANSRSIKRTPQTVVLPTADDSEKKWIDPKDNPEAANAAIEKILSETATSPSPEIEFPEADTVTLPGGLTWQGSTINTVEVKELTGEDEESLARASQSANPFSFLDRLLRCGVTKIGTKADDNDEKLLGKMLIGDREAIILGIRRATYGDTIEMKDWTCPDCGNVADLDFKLDDIPSSKLSDPHDSVFSIPLRKGGSARVRLANGEDQLAIFEKADITQAQRETILLSRCVLTITDVNGTEKNVQAFPSLSRMMSVPDRHKILRELGARQPGPKYDQVKFECDNCGKDQHVTVSIGDLFLDFGWV